MNTFPLHIKYHSRITHYQNVSLTTYKAVFIPRLLLPLNLLPEYATVQGSDLAEQQITFSSKYQSGSGWVTVHPQYFEIKINFLDGALLHFKTQIAFDKMIEFFFRVPRESYIYGLFMPEDDPKYTGSQMQMVTCMMQLFVDLFVGLIQMYDKYGGMEKAREHALWYIREGKFNKSHKNPYEKVVWYLGCDIIIKYNEDTT